MSDQNGELEAREAIAYTDKINKERGRKFLQWAALRPEDDPDVFTGLDDGRLVGPGVRRGKRYRIRYAKPTILPFHTPAQRNMAFQVLQVEGRLSATGFHLRDVSFVYCNPDNESDVSSGTADKSIFRVAVDDEIQEV